MLAPTLPLRRQGRVDSGSVSLLSLEFTSSLAIALSYSVPGKELYRDRAIVQYSTWLSFFPVLGFRVFRNHCGHLPVTFFALQLETSF